MIPTFVKSLYRNIYKWLKTILMSDKARRHGEVGRPEVWRMKRAFQIRFLKEQGLQPVHLFLDLGCGTLRGGIPVIEYLDEGRYTGIDIQEELLDEAKKELREEGLEHKRPHLVHMHSFPETDLKKKYDVIWAYSVLIHMDDNTLRQCMEFVRRHLKDDGVMFANVNLGNRAAGSWKEFPVVFRPEGFYRQMASTHGLSMKKLGTLKSLGHHSGVELSDRQMMLEFRIDH